MRIGGIYSTVMENVLKNHNAPKISFKVHVCTQDIVLFSSWIL